MNNDQTIKKNDAKSLVKILSTYPEKNGNGDLEQDEYNETKYVFYFIEPFFRNVLRYSEVKLKCGESFLRITAKGENDDLYNEEHRSKGPRIYMIIRNKPLNIDIATVEVSGQNSKANQVHFRSDRYKLCKNMKTMLKNIIGIAPFAPCIEKRKLKIYGFHIYLNILYIYSLHQPDDKSYIFLVERTFPILTCQAKLPAEFTLFVSNMWIIEKLINDKNDQIQVLLKSSRKRLVLSSDSNSSSDEVVASTPHKLQK